MKDGAPKHLILWFFLALFLVSLILLGWLMRPFHAVLVLGAVVAGMFTPVYGFFRQRLGPSPSSLLTCLLVFFLLFVPIVFLVGVLSTEAIGLVDVAANPDFLDRLKNIVEGSRWTERANELLGVVGVQVSAAEINQGITEVGGRLGLFLYQQARAIASNLLQFFISFIFMLVVIYFLLIDGPRVIAFIRDLSPLPDDQDQKLIDKFKDISAAILVGNGLAGIVQGIIGGVVFHLVGLPSPVVWGVVMGLLAFLPIVGIGVVLLPAAGYLLLSGRVAGGVFLLVIYAVALVVVEYVLKPRLVGRRANMHTLLVFFAIIGGLKIFGILGIIYGPVIVSAFLTLAEIYSASYRDLVEPGPEGGDDAAECIDNGP